MSSFLAKKEGRAGQFKKTIDSEDSRRKREDSAIQIRKEKRENEINKRRHIGTMEGGSPFMEHGAMLSDFGSPVDHAMRVSEQQQLEPLVRGIFGDDPEQWYQCTMHFRKMLSMEKNPPIEAVINAGCVPKFIHFLQIGNPQLQFEAAWALTNIASGTSMHTHHIVQAGAVPVFINLLMSPSKDVCEQAVWALGNIAGDSPSFRDLVLRNNALTLLFNLIQRPDIEVTMLRNATWTLSNFCRGKPQPPFDLIRSALPTLAFLIHQNDTDVLTDACWALSYVSDGPNERIAAVIESGVCRRLIELLQHAQGSVQTPALRTVGNVVTGDESQTQVMISCGVLKCLGDLLRSPRKGIRKEACWTISNITAGNKDQIDAVIGANLIPPLNELLKNGDYDVRKEAVWALSNATSGGTPEQISYLVRQGCIPPMCELLRVHDAKIVAVALEGLDNILKVGDTESRRTGTANEYALFVEQSGGIENIEALQKHQNHDIYDQACKIIEKYFHGEDDEEDAEYAPSIDSETDNFTFSMPSTTNQFNGFR